MELTSRWAIVYEYLSGDTENSTQATASLLWESATVTLRRRAPHTFEIRLPRNTIPYQRAVDFRAGRQLWFTRNDTYWLAGFMNSASLGRFDRRARSFTQVVLPGWGNAYAMLMNRAVQNNTSGAIDISYGSFDVDGFITVLLNDVDHGSGGDWFPVGGRTLYASATTFTWGRLTGRTALELLNWACDIDQVAWRTGVAADGTFTIAVGTTVERDLSSTIQLYDSGNCQIVDLQRDGSQIATSVSVVNRRAAVDTRLDANAAAAAVSISVASTAGFQVGDALIIGVGLATAELRGVTAVTSAYVLAISALANAHTRGETVKNNVPTEPFRISTRSAAASVAQNYHIHRVALFNDQMVNVTMRQEYGDAYLAAYDHPLTTATVEILDPTMIALLLENDVEPGDRVWLTSADSELIHFYNGTLVMIQEMTLELEPAGCRRIMLSVGDPKIDDLAVMDRWLSVHQSADTTARGE